MSPSLQTAVACDWAEDLGEFPRWAVEAACRAWRRGDHRRPTPHDIRALCQAEVRRQRTTLDRLRQIATPS